MRMARVLHQLSPLEQQLATDFARAVRERYGDRVSSLRVFGSRARGEARPDSDLDILVLLEAATLDDRRAISDLATDLMLEHLMGFEVAPRVLSCEEFQRLVSLERLFPAEVERDGIVL